MLLYIHGNKKIERGFIMKKIIGGKVYNSQTAQCLGCWCNGLPWNDFGYCSEFLHLTKSGNYFIYGEGGPLSKYAVHHGNSTSGGEVIKPISYAEAKEWAEENLTGDEYESAFGVPDDTKVALNVDIAKELKQKIDRIKSESNKSLSEIIEGLIAQL